MSNSIDEVLNIESSVNNITDKKAITKIQFADAMKWAEEGKKIPPLGRIFGNFILERNLVLFIAERGVGKSFFCLDLGLAISSGLPNFCGQALEKHGNVLYLDWELGEVIMKLRLKDTSRTVESLSHNFSMQITCLSTSLSELMPELELNIKKFKPVLIIIDNLRTAFLGDDNEKNYKMSQAIMELKILTQKYETAILLVHHTRKGISGQESNSDMQSGAGSITDLIDADFIMRQSKRNERYKILKRMKSRHVISDFKAKLIEFTDEYWFKLMEDDANEKFHIISEFNNKKSGDIVNDDHEIEKRIAQTLFGSQTILTFSELINRMKTNLELENNEAGKSKAKRLIKRFIKLNVLIKDDFGKYSINYNQDLKAK